MTYSIYFEEKHVTTYISRYTHYMRSDCTYYEVTLDPSSDNTGSVFICLDKRSSIVY